MMMLFIWSGCYMLGEADCSTLKAAVNQLKLPLMGFGAVAKKPEAASAAPGWVTINYLSIIL